MEDVQPSSTSLAREEPLSYANENFAPFRGPSPPPVPPQPQWTSRFAGKLEEASNRGGLAPCFEEVEEPVYSDVVDSEMDWAHPSPQATEVEPPPPVSSLDPRPPHMRHRYTNEDSDEESHEDVMVTCPDDDTLNETPVSDKYNYCYSRGARNLPLNLTQKFRDPTGKN